MTRRTDAITLSGLITDMLQACGVSHRDASVTADVLVSAELRDIPSHGIIRLVDYIRMLRNGRIKADAKPRAVHQSPSTVTLDGDNGLGPVVADRAMDYAIEKAVEAGTGWVAVLNSNHFGIAGFYAMKALAHNMIGLCVCNANPLVAPTFGAGGMLGTNPLAVAIPAANEPPLVADFATAAIARGKVDLLHRQGMPIDTGFVQDASGTPSNDPGILQKGGAILPLGSTRKYGSHKGYCMASVIDIFSGPLSGANFGPFVPPSVAWLDTRKDLPGIGTGHFFGALRIDAFRPADAFLGAVDLWIQTMRGTPAAKGHDAVMIPGDPERIAEERNKKKGIPVNEAIAGNVRELCGELNIDCPL